MRVVILHNVDGNLAAGSEDDAKAVAAVGQTAREAQAACSALGHAATLLPCPSDPELLCAALRSARPDAIVNLCESLRGEARLEAAAAALLELVGIPFTGSGSRTLGLALEKPLAKAILRDAGIPTPESQLLRTGHELLRGLAFPVIVKPSREDASHGISTASVCHDEASARARASWVVEQYRQPALVEEFVDGRELNVSLLETRTGLRVLPLAEIDFRGFPAGKPKLVTYEAKWVESSPEYAGTPVVTADDLEPALADRVTAIAVQAWEALDLRGYGRVDLRICPRRGPQVLEVNPNPDLSREAGFARAAARGGLTYEALLAILLEAAGAPR